MSILFTLILLIALVCLVIGLINPSLFKKVKLDTRKKVFCCFGIIFIIAIIGIGASSPVGSTTSDKKTSTSTADQVQQSAHNIGSNGYLRSSTDNDGIACLAVNKDDETALIKVIQAGDVQGLLNLGDKAFCVTNGSKVLVIDESVGLREVRITEGAKSVDQDKINLTGWVPFEWVVDN